MTTTESKRLTFSGQPFVECDHLINADGQYLFCKYWKPSVETRFLVFMLHGFGGHCARFEELALHVNNIGGFAFAHDHVGHGESEGPRTTIHDYNIYIRDAYQHVELIKSDYPDLPIFLYGQSMGGALAVLAANERPEFFRGVVVLGGQLITHPELASPVKKILVRVIGNLLPSLHLSELPESSGSRDEAEVEIAKNDPLKSCIVKSQMALQLLRIQEGITAMIDSFTPPFIALHGGADVACDPEGSRRLHRCAKSNDKTLKIYENCYHDLIHELPDDRRRCIEDIVEWITQRC